MITAKYQFDSTTANYKNESSDRKLHGKNIYIVKILMDV